MCFFFVEELDEVRFVAYRTAMKLRAVQKNTRSKGFEEYIVISDVAFLMWTWCNWLIAI